MAEVLEDLNRADVDVALEAWARWAKSVFDGLGWSSTSLIAKVMEYGIRGAAQSAGIKYLEVDKTCELVDRAIMRLDEVEREVVVRTYLESHTAQITAQKCGLTYQYYRNVLSRARRRIGDYLDGARASVV